MIKQNKNLKYISDRGEEYELTQMSVGHIINVMTMIWDQTKMLDTVEEINQENRAVFMATTALKTALEQELELFTMELVRRDQKEILLPKE